MSVSYNVYLGPYIQVHNSVKPKMVKRKSCPKTTCQSHGKKLDHQFCSHCGSKIQDIEVQAKGKVDFDIYEEFGTKEPLTELRFEGMPDDLTDYLLLKSNKENGPGREFEGVQVIPMDGGVPKDEIETLEQFHAKEIARLKEVFGAEAVTIKWGAIAYYW